MYKYGVKHISSHLISLLGGGPGSVAMTSTASPGYSPAVGVQCCRARAYR